MLFVVCCRLLALVVRLSFISCCYLFVGRFCGLLLGVCCVLCVACCLLLVICFLSCVLFVAGRLLCVVCCLLFVVYGLVFVC